VVPFIPYPAGATPDGKVSDTPFCTAEYDFRLARA
jgi:hypothetical protein